MLARIQTCAICGIDAASVDVEVQIRRGPPRFNIIGLADNTVRESRDRVISAIKHSGFFLPPQILVNLAPAEMKKEGSSFDLPIAVGVLAASGQIKNSRLRGMSFHGELSLDGSIKPIRGALSLAIEALSSGATEVIVPPGNRDETRLVSGLKVLSAQSLAELAAYLNGAAASLLSQQDFCREVEAPAVCRLSEVWGQESAKRALLIAAAGCHNLLMIMP